MMRIVDLVGEHHAPCKYRHGHFDILTQVICHELGYPVSMQVDYRAQFESDYEAYADAIFRFLYYRLQNRERALEITQDVFTRYFQYLADGNQVEHVKTFLYRSASNAFINEIRTKKRVVSLEEAVDSGLEVAYDGHDAEQMSQQRE